MTAAGPWHRTPENFPDDGRDMLTVGPDSWGNRAFSVGHLERGRWYGPDGELWPTHWAELVDPKE